MKQLHHFLSLFVLLILLSSTGVSAQTASNNIDRERFISNIIKNTLETYHYRRMKIDDSVSQKAFAEFLKKMDYGKQFFLKSDVEELQKYQFKMRFYLTRFALLNPTK